MENMSFMKKMSLMLTVAVLMGSSVTTQANLLKKAAIVAVIADLARLACKTAPAKDRLTVTTALEKLSENASKGELFAIVKLGGKFFDDVIVGFKGKNNGLRVAGSSTIIEGDDTLTTGIQDGEAMQFYMKSGHDHYGFTATTLKYLKEFKEMLETIDKTSAFLGSKDPFHALWLAAPGA